MKTREPFPLSTTRAVASIQKRATGWHAVCWVDTSGDEYPASKRLDTARVDVARRRARHAVSEMLRAAGKRMESEARLALKRSAAILKAAEELADGK